MVRLMYSLLLVLITSLPCLAENQLWNEADKKADREALSTEVRPIQSWAPLVTKVAPAVVNISEKFSEKERETRSIGSGIIINKRGHILTASHILNNLLKNAPEIKVTLLDHRSFAAKIIGRDSSANVAILKIEADGDLPIALLGDSEKLSVGDFVISIGNPFGSWPVASAGIVSALGGAGVLNNLSAGFIQTDASINAGNAGGPLCNIAGEIIGVNAALIIEERKVGFATPINVAKIVIKKFISQNY